MSVFAVVVVSLLLSFSAQAQTTLKLCGTVGAYVAPSALLPGLLTIGPFPYVLAAGTNVAGAASLTAGANVCITAQLNLGGDLTGLLTVTPNVTTTLQTCGVVGAYVAATANAAGSLTIGQTVIPIAAGTVLANSDLLTAGTHVCLGLTLNGLGQIVLPSTISLDLSGTLSVCGIVDAYVAATASTAGSITIGGIVYAIAPGVAIANSSVIAAGASVALTATLDTSGRIITATVALSSCGATSADLALMKSASPASVNVGDTLTYTIVATNQGPGAAADVTVVDVLPSPVTFVSATSTQGSCSGTSTVTCAIGTLASGASATVTIKVIPTATGQLSNTASVTSTTSDPNPTNNTTPPVTTTVVQTAPSSADVAITKSGSPAAVNVGDTLTYTLVASNHGPDAAAGVTIVDTLPSPATFVSATSTQGSCSGTSTVTCALGTLASGASATITIKVIPTTTGQLSNTASVTSTTSDPNPTNNTTPPVTTTVVQTAPSSADVAITKSASPAAVNVGDTLTYTLVASNHGPDAAMNVTVVDSLPSSTTLVSTASTQGSCSGTSTVTCTIGTLASGASAIITIRVIPTSTGTLSNTASVTSTTSDPSSANNFTPPVLTPVTQTSVNSADVGVTKSASASTVDVGDTLTYTIVATNHGPDAAANVTVVDVLPSTATFVAATSTQGSCSGTSTVACALGTLASGASATITIRVIPTSPGLLSNAASVTSATPDPNASNDVTPPVLTTVDQTSLDSADVSITKSASPSTGSVGETLTYTIVATNHGPGDAHDVTVIDALPSSVTLLSATSSQGLCAGTSTVTCAVGTLTAGTSATVTILVVPTLVGTLKNAATVTGATPDPDPTNNTTPPIFTVVFGPVDPTSEFRIDANLCNSHWCTTLPFSFEVMIRNEGTSTASNVEVAGALPSSIHVQSVVSGQGFCTETVPVRCMLGELDPGQSTWIHVTGVASEAGAHSVHFAVLGEAGAQMAQTTFTLSADDCQLPLALYIPTVGAARGVADVGWKSELRILNPDDTAATVTLDWFALSESGRTQPDDTLTLTVLPGQHTLDHVLTEFAGESGLGSIRVQSDRQLGVSARVYHDNGEGTFGDHIPVIPLRDARSSGTLMGLRTGADPGYRSSFRTNIGYFNPSATAIPLTVRAYDRDLRLLGSHVITVAPHANALMPASAFAAIDPGFRGEFFITYETGGRPLVIFSAMLDETSNDTSVTVSQDW